MLCRPAHTPTLPRQIIHSDSIGSLIPYGYIDTMKCVAQMLCHVHHVAAGSSSLFSPHINANMVYALCTPHTQLKFMVDRPFLLLFWIISSSTPLAPPPRSAFLASCRHGSRCLIAVQQLISNTLLDSSS